MMSSFTFYKYQGCGNDFIIFDGINATCPQLSQEQIAFLCNRKFGIGADGLMYILPHDTADFYMQYFNADGGESSMCGNGGRCIAHLAHALHITSNHVNFVAVDGPHTAHVDGNLVALGMQNINCIEKDDTSNYILNTGSPHYVKINKSDDANEEDIVIYGKKIRYNDTYRAEGINVNMVSILNKDTIKVATYERGVEDETLSCGTGVTACALVMAEHFDFKSPVHVETKGGNLEVYFDKKNPQHYNHVVLKGPAVYVYKGQIEL